MTEPLRSRDLQKLLGLTRTQVLHWSRSCLAEPPVSPPLGTGHHQHFSARNAVDLGIVRELIECGLSTRRIRNVLSTFRGDPYHAADQKNAIARYLKSSGNPQGVRLYYDFLIVYRDPDTKGQRLVGRASGEGVRWWLEPKPKRFLHAFVNKKGLSDRVVNVKSLAVVNVAALRELVHDHSA